MDIYHYFGNDIAVNVNGDLQAVDGLTESQQRILRRLLTNPGDYIWHPNYGAGLPRYVGQALSTSKYLEIKGLINSQIALEQSVAKTPAPVISLAANQTSLYCTIQYTEAASKTLQTLSFNVSN